MPLAPNPTGRFFNDLEVVKKILFGSTNAAYVTNSAELEAALDAKKGPIYLAAGPDYEVSDLGNLQMWDNFQIIGEKLASDPDNSLNDGVRIIPDSARPLGSDWFQVVGGGGSGNLLADIKTAGGTLKQLQLTAPNTITKGSILEIGARSLDDSFGGTGDIYWYTQAAAEVIASDIVTLEDYIPYDLTFPAGASIYWNDGVENFKNGRFENVHIACFVWMQNAINFKMKNVVWGYPVGAGVGISCFDCDFILSLDYENVWQFNYNGLHTGWVRSLSYKNTKPSPMGSHYSFGGIDTIYYLNVDNINSSAVYGTGISNIADGAVSHIRGPSSMNLQKSAKMVLRDSLFEGIISIAASKGTLIDNCLALGFAIGLNSTNTRISNCGIAIIDNNDDTIDPMQTNVADRLDLVNYAVARTMNQQTRLTDNNWQGRDWLLNDANTNTDPTTTDLHAGHDGIVRVNCTTKSVIIKLTHDLETRGNRIRFIEESGDVATYTVNIIGMDAFGQTPNVDGVASYAMTANETLSLFWDGFNWIKE